MGSTVMQNLELVHLQFLSQRDFVQQAAETALDDAAYFAKLANSY